MADTKVVQEWLEKADEDFNFASSNLIEKDSFFAQICFHFQQAAEKYLKSFIVAYDLEFEKIHNLFHLLEICTRKDSSLNSLQGECDLLNSSYIDTRYPVHWPTDYTKDKALKAQEAARKISEAIKNLLKDAGIINEDE